MTVMTTDRSATRRQVDTRSFSDGGLTFETRVPFLFPVVEQLALAADNELTLLLIGETGTGKSTLARLLHANSPRRTAGFMSVSCGALHPTLIESELFGHVRGAFTGADTNKVGRFEAVGQGTLLLDEIDALGLEQQAKLLKVIETGEFEPVGSTEIRHSSARVIAASNISLDKLVEMRRFRDDLFYRLNILKFELPPLRERVPDILPLAQGFIAEYCTQYKLPLPRMSKEFASTINQYHWPGNLRELKNCMLRAVVLCRDGLLTPALLPQSVAQSVASRLGIMADSLLDPFMDQFAGNYGTLPGPSSALADKVAITEKEVIIQTLRRCGNNRTKCAKELGVSRVTLYNKIRRYGLLNENGEDQGA